ncbi:MAG: putative addiction module antidote protein [Azonexus sp.]|jgi:probable addiction module antidote protein|nr:putative addiction module antidote protein [Azonexus sp.]
MTLKTIPFDIAAELSTEADIQEYFSQVMADGDTDEIIRALSHIARARGMAKLAADTGLGRESLYKTLSAGSKPRFETILKITRALGLRLTAESQSKHAPA